MKFDFQLPGAATIWLSSNSFPRFVNKPKKKKLKDKQKNANEKIGEWHHNEPFRGDLH